MTYKIADEQLSLFKTSTPNMPKLDTSRCNVRPINYETAARMVETYHYAHRVPNIVLSYGLYVDDILAGCITYGIPAGVNVQASICGEEYKDNTIELNRLFIHDWAGFNSESWIIGQSFKMMPQQYNIIISFADKKENHFGIIYQATNWIYTGISDPGGAKEVIINGKKYHSKNIYNTFGTRDLDKLSSDGNNINIIGKSLKYRYVYFLGSKSQRKTLRKALKLPVLPYPKGDKK